MNHEYFEDKLNDEILSKVIRKSYLPANKILLDLINSGFRCGFSITGTLLDQFEKHPKILESFKKLAKTGSVEFLAETYHHSLASVHSEKEFKEQVRMHSDRISKISGRKPSVFRNTELIYSNDIAKMAADLGFNGILSEGPDQVLGWKTPNVVYQAVDSGISVLLKNHKLSDDIAFRFSEQSWDQYPLTADKFVSWLMSIKDADTVNLFIDYETFGEHQWKETGIFKFLTEFPAKFMAKGGKFLTPSQVISKFPPKEKIDIKQPISWADVDRDLSAWQGNDMQKKAIEQLYMIEDRVKASKDKNLIEDWRRLSTSDHFYYMCTKYFNDGDVHRYFNPYDSPYDSFIAFMNIMNDLNSRIDGSAPSMITEAIAK